MLAHVRKNPGQRGKQIAAELGTDTKALRGAMKRLIEAGQIKTKGERRGMRYFGRYPGRAHEQPSLDEVGRWLSHHRPEMG